MREHRIDRIDRIDMKTLTNLKADGEELPFVEPPVHHHLMGEDLGGGLFRAIKLGPAGIIFTNLGVSCVIPLGELWRLAETHEPGLRPPGPGAKP